MSLFKYISIVLSIFLLFVVASVMTLNFHTATFYAEDDLYSNAQNTASSLSLSLASAKGDISEMSTMINAVFDSGFYKQISIIDRAGKDIYTRKQESSIHSTPQWFTNLFVINIQTASAHVSSGWTPIGILTVTSHEQSAYEKLYTLFIKLLDAFIIISFIASILLYFLLSIVLASLKKVKKQAEAVGKNEFYINKDISYITEFKEVSIAMNKMVQKVQDIFEKEVIAVNNYHKILYTDTLTGFGNKKYFDIELKNMTQAEGVSTNGLVLSLYFDKMPLANETLGREGVDKLICNFTSNINEITKDETHLLKTRIDGSKIVLIFSNTSLQNLNKIADRILITNYNEIQETALKDCTCNLKMSLIKYFSTDTNLELMIKIDQSLLKASPNTLYIEAYEENDSEDQKKLLIQTLNNKSISLALQGVFDESGNIYHKEAYIRLLDSNKELMQASTFLPLVHELGLDTKLDNEVISYAIKHIQNTKEPLAINLSLAFIKDKASLTWLSSTLSSLKIVLAFEISNKDVLSSFEEVLTFSKLLRDTGHILGIDRFTATSTDLQYLQTLSPTYIKIDSHYLRDMFCSKSGIQNNALQIMVQSLDIDIIASYIEEESVKTALQDVGIKYFQGSLLQTPQSIKN